MDCTGEPTPANSARYNLIVDWTAVKPLLSSPAPALGTIENNMDVEQQINSDQRALWNGVNGRAWVDEQKVLDRIFKPFEDLLAGAVSDGESVRRVLDVGCGAGGTTLAVARRLGERGRCTGIDISEPMITRAQSRAERNGTPATFYCADAQTYVFEPASFDRIISRFGVMFFDDPVKAFGNLRRAAAEHAEMRLIVWRSPAENPFMTTAERAAASLLPDLPPRQPGAPGQFAFADQDRVRRILEDSGWAQIDIQPLDVACMLPEAELVQYFTRLGPVGLVLQDADEQKRAAVIEAVRPAFNPYVHGSEVRFTAACWMISARAT